MIRMEKLDEVDFRQRFSTAILPRKEIGNDDFISKSLSGYDARIIKGYSDRRFQKKFIF